MDSNGDMRNRVTFRTFFQLFMRSFFVQGSFSMKHRQNIGFAFCVEPLARIFWEDQAERHAFFLRHTEYYNGNPFMASLVLGAVAKMEEMLRYEQGIQEKDISIFKKAAGAATGSVGDRFFWGSLRPLGVIMGLLTAFYYGVWGVLLLLAVFNIPAFVLRWHWLKTGYRLGPGVVAVLKNKNIERTARIMERITAALLAFMAVSLILGPDSAITWVSVAGAGLFAANFILLKEGVSLPVVLTLSVIAALITGIILTHVVY